MIIRRIFALLLALLFMLYCPCGRNPETVPVTVEGAVFGGNAGDKIGTELEYDPAWVTTASNRIYNSKLAAFSALLCTDVYFRAKDVAKGTQNRVCIDQTEGEYSQTALLERLGYADAVFIETYKAKQYPSDTNDSATILAAYKNVDGKYDSYIFVLRGCSSIGERLSAFDVGCDSAEYNARTGEHGEWTNRARFKGIDVATNRAMEYIRAFIAEHDDTSRPNTVLVTGHSRGGALANCIGADLEKDRTLKTYTYTFNAMASTNDRSTKACKTVFNLFDTNDYYTDPLPFGQEHFVRYGIDLPVNIAENRAIRESIAALKGREDYACLSPEAKAEHDKLFAERFPDRDSLYKTVTVTETSDTQEEAAKRLETVNSMISGLAISDYCKASPVAENADGTYAFTLEYCGAALLFGFAQIEAYGDAAYDAFLTLFAQDTVGCRIAGILAENLAGINAGHLLINGYVLSGFCRCFPLPGGYIRFLYPVKRG